MEITLSVIGGDRRQAELARLLAADGYKVSTYGLVRWEAEGDVDLEAAIRSEIIVLPLPLCREDGVLNCAEAPILVTELFQRLHPEQRILAGQINAAQFRAAEALDLKVADYFLREEVTVANAALTAEAALQVAMEHLDCSIQGMDCLVVGFGRIGKLLSRYLSAVGARVTATARKPEDLAWIRAFGWEAARTDSLAETMGRFSVVFNTVPALVLDETLLGRLSKSCLCVDLASQRGIDPDAAERLGIEVLWARALPGRLKPRAAAGILRDAIYDILMEG